MKRKKQKTPKIKKKVKNGLKIQKFQKNLFFLKSLRKKMSGKKEVQKSSLFLNIRTTLSSPAQTREKKSGQISKNHFFSTTTKN